MRAIFVRQWFLLALAATLVAGMFAGIRAPRPAVEGFLFLVRPAFTTAIVLFLMAFSLDTSRLREALAQPVGALLGAAINLGLAPLLAWPASRFQLRPDFALGIAIAMLAPCTLATASVFTRRAGGNDAISLLVTLVTNVLCVAISPLWLGLWLTHQPQIELTAIGQQLVVCVLLPTLAGQGAQSTAVGRAVLRAQRQTINLAAQGLVLLLVAVAAVHGGTILRAQPTSPDASALLAMVAACAALHGVLLAAGWWGGRLLRLRSADVIAVALAGSQKTLPVGLLIATHPAVAATGLPFVTFPLLAYHASQLLIDALLADRWAQRSP